MIKMFDDSFSSALDPVDSFSEEMLKSIPKKIRYWLESCGKSENEGSTEEDAEMIVSWQFEEEDVSCITFVDNENENIFKIWWEGPADNAHNIKVYHKIYADISKNLDKFAHLEEQIYTTMEHFLSEPLSYDN